MQNKIALKLVNVAFLALCCGTLSAQEPNDPCLIKGVVEAIDQAKRVIVISGTSYGFVSFKVPVRMGNQVIDPARLRVGSLVKYGVETLSPRREAVTGIWIMAD